MVSNHKRGASSTLFAISTAAATVAAAAALWYYHSHRQQQREHPKSVKMNNNTNDEAQLQADFALAAEASKGLTNLHNGDKLLLYGLYKQATVGDIAESSTSTNNNNNKSNIHPPSSWNVVAHAKYQAHAKFQGMSCAQAMQEYVHVVGEFQRALRDGDVTMEYDTQTLDMWNAMGVRPSMPVSTNHHDGLEEDESDNVTEEESTAEARLVLQAARSGNMQALQQIVDRCQYDETNGNNNNNNNKTSLDNTVRVLLNTQDESGQSALHFGADRGHDDMVAYLLQQGANVHLCDCDGISVLQAAVIAGHTPVAKLLLQHGANPLQEDMDGDTPMSCAMDDGSSDMIQLLTEYVAKKNQTANAAEGETVETVESTTMASTSSSSSSTADAAAAVPPT